ncbi:hypothetical protein L2E82_47128 [Cichorium intybus]|uniref:Uncharacterized protein n=1 Tax=Cichorium intybus TaxID=13427 RepID=A0ACB8YVP2_CICIN|nr:hypothetical protein L2E82_47128 [Cichorium intybus]
MKCESRAVEGMCSPSCGCNPKKCSNRETLVVETFDSQPPMVNVDGDVNLSDDKDLAIHGVMLLQAALADKPTETNNVDRSKRLTQLSTNLHLISHRVNLFLI